MVSRPRPLPSLASYHWHPAALSSLRLSSSEEPLLVDRKPAALQRTLAAWRPDHLRFASAATQPSSNGELSLSDTRQTDTRQHITVYTHIPRSPPYNTTTPCTQCCQGCCTPALSLHPAGAPLVDARDDPVPHDAAVLFPVLAVLGAAALLVAPLAVDEQRGEVDAVEEGHHGARALQAAGQAPGHAAAGAGAGEQGLSAARLRRAWASGKSGGRVLCPAASGTQPEAHGSQARPAQRSAPEAAHPMSQSPK